MGSCASWDHLCVFVHRAIKWCSVVWSWSLGWLALGCLWKGSSAGKVQQLSVTGLWISGRSYKANNGWYLSVLELEVCGRGISVNQSPLPIVLGLGKNTQGTSRPASAFQLLVIPSFWKTLRKYENWVRCGLRESLRWGWVVFTRLMHVQIWHQCWTWVHSVKGIGHI